MKYYQVIGSDYCDEYYMGMYSTLEKAEERVKEIVEDDCKGTWGPPQFGYSIYEVFVDSTECKFIKNYKIEKNLISNKYEIVNVKEK